MASKHRGRVANASIYLGDTGRLSIRISKIPIELDHDDDDDDNVDFSGRMIELTCHVIPSSSGKMKMQTNIYDIIRFMKNKNYIQTII